MKKLLKIEDLSVKIGYSAQHLYRLSRSGQLPVIRIGGSVRFDEAEIDRWIDGQRGVSELKK